MSKSNAFETDILGLIFNATAIANIADDAGTAPLANLYLSLHTADPGEAGNQSTTECAYTSYARAAVTRDASGFTVSGNAVTLTSAVEFPEATGGSETATHFAIGVAATGASKILYSGALTPTIAISTGVMPRLGAGTTITED
jgi:hypothetical protein